MSLKYKYKKICAYYSNFFKFRRMSRFFNNFGINISPKDIKEFMVLGELIIQIDETYPRLLPTLRENIQFYSDTIRSEHGIYYSEEDMRSIISSMDTAIYILKKHKILK